MSATTVPADHPATSSRLITPGHLITLEGGEGGGKSTQARALVARLRAAGLDALATREPGGSAHAESIRAVLLAGTFEHLGPDAEALLFAAARIDHLDVTIRPALALGRWVVSDRFHDSTRAYQGAAGALAPSFLDALERVSLGDLRPALTLILDVPAHVGLARADARRRDARDAGVHDAGVYDAGVRDVGVRDAEGWEAGGGDARAPDRFERESLGFHEGLRRAFLTIAAAEPERCVVVDATATPADVEQAIWDTVTHRLLYR